MSEKLPGWTPSDGSVPPEAPSAPEPTVGDDPALEGDPALHDDPAFDRLRAADPAAGAAPDADRLAATLRAATGVDVGRTDGATGSGPAAEVARRRWRPAAAPRWLQIAAAVAALAVVGGGAYALGGRTGGSSTAGATPLPAIALGGPQVGGPQRAGADMAAPANGAASGSASSSSIAVPAPGRWWGSRTVFTASGLSTAGGTGTARAFDAASVVSADTVRRAAKVLGVAGEPRAQWGTWTVGTLDGKGAVLTLSGDGMATLSYSDPAWDPWTCTGEKAAANASVCGPNAAAAPTGDAAVAKVRALFHALGVDLTGATVQVGGLQKPVRDAAGATVPTAGRETVMFSQVVDGQLTGVTWSATLVGSGVQSLWGPLAPLVDLGRYQVVSPAAAVERLNDPRFGAYGGGPMPMVAGGVQVDSGAAEPAVGSATSGAVPPPDGASTGSATSGAVPSQVQPSVTAPSAAASSGTASSGTAPSRTAGSGSSGSATSGAATAGPGVIAPAPAVTPGAEPTAAPSSTAPPVAPTTPSAGSAIAWPVRHVTITSARLGLAVTTLPSGAAVLVPTYQLTDADGGTWSVIAVVDAQLDLTAAG
ncbi:hypothetical protein [Cellulomonas sp. NTE-D12]|uniref:hypothetical protein n=1 Tax=Cellulomonas sp. NTE-D12 TaxID=2962632 RepID=UPI00308210FE|nr:hypothetical protein CELD12_30200 [Cellulomonas sp. NTE-D12]